MDLTNKQVTIQSLSVNTFPPSTVAKVVVSEEVIPGVFVAVATYDMTFDKTYNGLEEPALLAAINEKLLLVP